MDVELREATRQDTPVLRRLMQLYLYDLSTIDGWDVGDDGVFGDAAKIEGFWADPKRRSFLIRVDGRLAGFALVRDGAHFAGEVGDVADEGEAREAAVNPDQERPALRVGPESLDLRRVAEDAVVADVPAVDRAEVVEVELHQTTEDGGVLPGRFPELDVHGAMLRYPAMRLARTLLGKVPLPPPPRAPSGPPGAGWGGAAGGGPSRSTCVRDASQGSVAWRHGRRAPGSDPAARAG